MMKAFLSNRCLLGVETMHGFDQAVAELIFPNVTILYAPLPVLIEACLAQSDVLGIVKGPRTSLHSQDLDLLACRQPALVISYIGRHPATILAPDIPSTVIRGKQTMLAVHTEHGDVPILSLAQSPLSSAVCAYVVNLSLELLQNSNEHVQQISIEEGNAFSIRRGHGFTESSLRGKTAPAHTNVAVIGAGDTGSKVIHSYAQAGVQVQYTSRREVACSSQWGRFIPSIEALLRSPTRIDVLTIHLPAGSVVPLELVRDVKLCINTSAGSCIDEDELLRALEEQRIQVALIDVFRQEGAAFYGVVDPHTKVLIQSKLNPYPHPLDNAVDSERKHRLRALIAERRLLLTPHIAYLEESAVRQTLSVALENIVAYHGISAPLATC